MQCLSGFELYSRWVPLTILRDTLLRTVALTPAYKGSFFPATINLWNSLPSELITQPNIKGGQFLY